MPVLARLWQMLLKGLGEVQIAPSPIQAAEMVLVRLAYVADLPAPAELVRLAQDGIAGAEPPPQRAAGPSIQASARPLAGGALPSAGGALRAPAELREPAAPAREAGVPAPPVAAAPEPMPQSFGEVLALFDQRREAVLRSHLAILCAISCISSRGGSSSGRPRARRATSPTVLANCLANGPGRAG